MRALIVLCALATAVFAKAQEPRLWMVYLIKGNAPRPGQAELEKLQAAHIANFKRLFGVKKLILAGPLADPTTVRRGLVVLWVPDEQAVKDCFLPDPYVQSGIMTIQMHPWMADRNGINVDDPDPEAIEENRIAMLNEARSIPAYLLRQHQAWISQNVHPSIGGGFDEKPYQSAYLFHGPDGDRVWQELQRAPLVQMGWLKLEVIPHWCAKRSLRDR